MPIEIDPPRIVTVTEAAEEMVARGKWTNPDPDAYLYRYGDTPLQPEQVLKQSEATEADQPE